MASANAKSEQECKRAQCAANREIDEYKERINKVRLTPATISVHAALHAARRLTNQMRCDCLPFLCRGSMTSRQKPRSRRPHCRSGCARDAQCFQYVQELAC